MGWCYSHYSMEYKKRRYLAHRSSLRHDSIGVERRLRALVAIGYDNNDLARETGLDPTWISKLLNNPRTRVNEHTRDNVVKVYDRLSMTPGPSQRARDRARRHGWVPPLAWDDETIDDPATQPQVGRKRAVLFVERFTELRELGYSDLEILGRMQIHPESLLRQLDRYGIKADPELVREATSRKHRRAVS